MEKFLIYCTFCFLFSCKSHSQDKGNKLASDRFFVDSVWFTRKPNLISSYLNMANGNGVSLRVYNFYPNKEQTIIFDSLLKKGYEKLPLKKFDELPLKLKPYLKNTDNGYYYSYEKDTYGEKFVILNMTDFTFIIYQDGIIN